MDKKINPCRYCGNTGVVVTKNDAPLRSYAYVKCTQCHARGPHVHAINIPEGRAEVLAIECWNGGDGYLREAAKE